MKRFANKVLQLGETNVKLKVHSNRTTPGCLSQCDLSDMEKIQNHLETESVL